jgi:hypothetical protein
LEQSGALPQDADKRTVEHFNTAFGLARTLERSLVEEVAATEASLVRHVLYLRRLVLRYLKTLLMFIWTTVVAFTMLPFLQEPRLPTLLIMGAGFTLWSVFVLPIMNVPRNWIYRHRHGEVNHKHIDRQLTLLERQMKPFCYAAIPASFIGMLLAAIYYF